MSNRKRNISEMEDDDIDGQDNQSTSSQNDFLFLFITITTLSVLIATECDYLFQTTSSDSKKFEFHLFARSREYLFT